LASAKGFLPFCWRFANLKDTLTHAGKNPAVGVTQGGSSRKDSGAKPAATTGEVKHTKHGKTKEKPNAYH